MSSTQPAVSVILPIYNGAAHLAEAIESVLTQSFRDLELIAIDDGSSDDSAAIARAAADGRVRVIVQENRGLAATLNRGLELAGGRYVARQDHDDIALPGRLERQVAFLDAHPAVAMVGTWAAILGAADEPERHHRHPCDDAPLRFALLFDNPFVHSSVMARTAVLRDVGGYTTDPARQPPEDYELWSRVARGHEVANIPEVLQCYREVQGSMSRTGDDPFSRHVVTVSRENITRALGGRATPREVSDLAEVLHGVPGRTQLTAPLTRLRAMIDELAQWAAPGSPELQRQLYRSAARVLLAQLPTYYRYRYRDRVGACMGSGTGKALALGALARDTWRRVAP